jgi:hypothetical protein
MCLECALNRRAEIDLAIQQVDDSQAYEGILLANALTIEGLSAQLVSLRAELKQARMTALGLAIGASMTEAA